MFAVCLFSVLFVVLCVLGGAFSFDAVFFFGLYDDCPFLFVVCSVCCAVCVFAVCLLFVVL